MKYLLSIIAVVLLMGAGCKKAEDNFYVSKPLQYRECESFGVCYIYDPIEREANKIQELERKLDQLLEAEGYIEFTEPAKEAVPEKTYLTKDQKKKEWVDLMCHLDPIVERKGKGNDRCREIAKELGL